jgi:hypothetical protein
MKSNSHVYESKHTGRKNKHTLKREAHLHERNKTCIKEIKENTLAVK